MTDIDRRSPEVLGARVFPYGASELKRLQPVYLRRALALACGIALGTLALSSFTVRILVRPAPPPKQVSVPYDVMLVPPPSLAPNPAPAVSVSIQGTPPAVATPLPVPDALAPRDIEIARQQDFPPTVSPLPGTRSDTPVVVLPPEPPDPDSSKFYYVDEYPVLIKEVEPVYPEIARQAGLEGTVRLRALVGTDGRVIRVAIDTPLPILDEAAAAAVRQWVFKPALTSNRPVKVWVSVPVRFLLH